MAIPSSGPSPARIAIVFDAPSREEADKAMLGVGAAGRLLNELLQKAGIDRWSCYLTSVLKVPIPKGDFACMYDDPKYRKQPKAELYKAWEDIQAELLPVHANVIIPLGTEALRAVTNDVTKSIGNWRGSICQSPVGKVVATYDPDGINKQWAWYPIALLDLQRAKEESRTPDIVLPKRNLMLKPTLSEALQYMEYIKNDCEFLSFDIETIRRGLDKTRLKTLIDCIGLAPSADEGMCIPFCYPNGDPYWQLGDEQIVWHHLAKLLRSNRTKKIGQNGQYDMQILLDHGVYVSNYWMDTMCAFHSTGNSEFPKSLDFLTSIYTRQPYYKDQIHGNRWEYNSLDATCTLEVAMGIWQDLKETGQEKFYFNHVHPLIIDFMYVQRKGVAVDEECCAEAIKVLQGEADEIQPKLDSYVGHPLNVNSPKQMITFLYTELGLPKQLNRKTSKPTADKEAVEKLAAKFQRPELMSVLEIRQRLDLISVLKTPRGLDGRMHTFYNVVGTETGRLASKESYDESGTNLQNIAKGWGRKIFIPDPGKILIGADLSQAEARYVAWDAQDLNLIGIFTSGGDVHKKTASLIFGVPEHEITPDQRQNAKKTVHASNYGMSYRTFARQHKIPESAAMRLQGSYFKAFPMIKLWQLSIMNEVKRTRELTNVFGRKHYFHGRYGDDLWKQAYAYLPQSTIADQMHRATHAIIARLPEGADYLLQVHDAIYCQCFPEQEAEVRAIMKEEMERPFIVKGKSLSIPADFHVGANWNECG